LAFFAARFSFRVLACFFRSSLWADLLAIEGPPHFSGPAPSGCQGLWATTTSVVRKQTRRSTQRSAADDQSRQGLTLDVLRDDRERLIRLRPLGVGDEAGEMYPLSKHMPSVVPSRGPSHSVGTHAWRVLTTVQHPSPESTSDGPPRRARPVTPSPAPPPHSESVRASAATPFGHRLTTPPT
jgi:hypothetical protein